MPVVPATVEVELILWFEANLSKIPEKQTKSKRPGGVAQVEEYLPSKPEALSSVPTSANKQNQSPNEARLPHSDSPIRA
jgi:hypothetical protein